VRSGGKVERDEGNKEVTWEGTRDRARYFSGLKLYPKLTALSDGKREERDR
jgi:hypothetical protein